MSGFKTYKRVLKNGLTVLVVPQTTIPKVALQLWYNVGSKDEQTGEKGIAHLIEHMVFKGTGTLSESDINLITHKLSGTCNAFTSYDYTGYLFNLPVQHWHYALPIMADCMVNCTFKEEFLFSELKAVIQEIKMYNDDYTSTLLEKLTSAIFPDHPYHYPVIGYKQDLWNLSREALVKFYEKHYVPNNATLVVVGAVSAEDVFKEAELAFGHLAPRPDYKKSSYYHSFDIVSQEIVLCRDVQQPTGMFAWVIPGTRSRQDYILDILSWVLGSGKDSRLVRRVVEEEKLATQLDSFVYDLFDYGLFVITFQPNSLEDIARIKSILQEEIQDISANGCSAAELHRAQKKTEMDFLSITEDQERCAYLTGKYFLATGDESYLASYLDSQDNKNSQIQALLATYLQPSLMHQGVIKGFSEQDKNLWLRAQQQSDEEDKRILSCIVRDCTVEEGVAVHKITTHEPPVFNFPQARSFMLPNGLKVLYYNNSQSSKIDIIVSLKTRYYYDPENKQGLQTFLMDMLQEGTTTHPGHSFAQVLESYGMSVSAMPGQITLSMLSADITKGLSLLKEMLTQAAFDDVSLEKVRTRIIADVIDYWDAPVQFIGQLARQAVYHCHPYHKALYGTKESIASITRQDLLNAYKLYCTPQEARIVVVGSLAGYDIEQLVGDMFADWVGDYVPDIHFPLLEPVKAELIQYPINRDQVVLAFAGLSVRRIDPDFDKLLLFDQVLTGGVLGSMSSRLFELREQSGLFYTIGGSLVTGAHREPGMCFIKTIVSADRLEEAARLIAQVIDRQAQDLTAEELASAQKALANSLVDNFTSNRHMAASFLFLDTFGLPATYFDARAQQLSSISLDEIKEAVARHVSTKHMVRIQVGRFAN